METDNTDNTDNLSTEEIKKICEEVNEDIKNIGEINDIEHGIPDTEQLNNLREMIDKLPRDKVIDLLNNLPKGRDNINPNGNAFATVKEKDLKQQALKQRLQQAKFNRMPKKSQQVMRQKYTEKIEKLKQTNSHNSHTGCCGENCGSNCENDSSTN